MAQTHKKLGWKKRSQWGKVLTTAPVLVCLLACRDSRWSCGSSGASGALDGLGPADPDPEHTPNTLKWTHLLLFLIYFLAFTSRLH